MQFDETQQEAIKRALDMSPHQRVVPITGGPGTGKSTIINHVATTLTDAGYDVCVAAPTGKAAKRVKELGWGSAKTVHRMLEFPYPGERDEKTGKVLEPGEPRRNNRDPLAHDVIIVDEYSMVSRMLHSQIIFAMKSGSVIRMIGDANQLQPIENHAKPLPSPFKVGLEKFKGVELTTIHRTSSGSNIPECSSYIARGVVPPKRDDFRVHYTNDPVAKLKEQFCDPIFGTTAGQIIAPTKKSWAGTIKLNILLQSMVGPETTRVSLDRHDWDKERCLVGIGDKVIWMENQYDMRDHELRTDMNGDWVPPKPENAIMNGECGIIKDIQGEFLIIDVGDRDVIVPRSYTVEVPPTRRRKGGIITVYPWKHIQLGYVITTHKAQGSEYERVCFVLNRSTQFMHCRSNIYTGVTRAKNQVDIITDQSSYANCIKRIKAPIENFKR